MTDKSASFSLNIDIDHLIKLIKSGKLLRLTRQVADQADSENVKVEMRINVTASPSVNTEDMSEFATTDPYSDPNIV